MPAGLEKAVNMGIEKWRTEWTDSPWTVKHPEWSPEVPAHRVEGQAGDCILCVASYTGLCSPPLAHVAESALPNSGSRRK